jgi:hypothetical protein
MRTHWFILTAAAAVLGGAPASAQGGSRDVGYTAVPPQAYPPRGMCRVWLDGLSPSQQPPVTDCATAERAARGQILVLDGNVARDFAGGWGSQKDCRDRNRDGVCDGDPRTSAVGYGPMPSMESAIAFARNQAPSDDIRRWVPSAATRVTLQNRPGSMRCLRDPARMPGRAAVSKNTSVRSWREAISGVVDDHGYRAGARRMAAALGAGRGDGLIAGVPGAAAVMVVTAAPGGEG